MHSIPARRTSFTRMGQESYTKLRTIFLVFFIIKLAIVLSLPAIVAQDTSDISTSKSGTLEEVSVAGEEVILPDAGTTPDSPFYGLDLAFERMGDAIALGKAAKAERGLKHAQERLSEVRIMVEKNKLQAAEKARAEHARKLQEVDTESDDDGIDDSRRNEIKRRLIQNRIHAERISDSMGMKMRLKAREMKLSQEQMDKLESFLASLAEENSAFEDTDDDSADDSADGNLSEFKAEKATEQIREATEEIKEAEQELGEFGDNESRTTRISAARKLIEEAKKKLANAETAFEEGKYGRAFGQATAAKMLAKHAQRILERSSGGDSDDESDDESEDSKERIKIRINTDPRDDLIRADVNANFYIEFKDRKDLVEKILKELSLSEEQVSELLKSGDEDEDFNPKNQEKKKIELKIRAKEGIAKVDFRMRFFINTAERSKAASEISSVLTALAESDLKDALVSREMDRVKEIKNLKMKLLEKRGKMKQGVERVGQKEIEGDDDEDGDNEDDDSDSTGSNSSWNWSGRRRG